MHIFLPQVEHEAKCFWPLRLVANLITRRQSITGWTTGRAADADDTLNFSKLQNIKCMVEKFPLEKAQEAFAHYQHANFRAVLVPGL